MSTAVAPSPSHARRNGLKNADREEGGNGVPLVSNFFPIERYYNAAEKLYEAFGKAFDERRLDDAYVYGLRFAEFSVEGLPKHDYYKGKRHEAQRRRNTMQVKEVIAKVEAVVVLMDKEEFIKQEEYRQRQEEAMRLEQEARKREEEKERQRFDALQERISKMKGRPSSSLVVSSESVETSAMSKLEMLRQPELPTKPPTQSNKNNHGNGSIDSERRKDRSGDGRYSSNDQDSIRRSASGSPDDRESHRRSRRSSVQNNGGSSSYEDADKRDGGHRRSTMSHSPTPSAAATTSGRRCSESSDEDTSGTGNGGSSNRKSSTTATTARPLPSSSSSSNNNKNTNSERSSTMRSTSTYSVSSTSSNHHHQQHHHHHHGSNGSSSSRVRNQSPSLLNDSGLSLSPLPTTSNNNNSWSQAPDPKDAWKLEKDDDEPVSSRFREHFPSNRHASSSSTTTTMMTPANLPKTNILPPPMLPLPPSYNQVVSALKTTDATSNSTVNARFRANQYFGPGGTGMGVGVPDFSMNNSLNRPFAAPAGGAKRLNMNEPSVALRPFGDTSSVMPAAITHPVRPVKPVERIPIRKLRDTYASDYRRAQQEGWIEIRPLDTYQGRLRQSTNGCTVISPLVVAHHLLNSAGGVLDAEIVDVIDKECGPLLREIRSKLGLEGDSLIIPSDVHDHLVDRKILQQNKFFGATGGNIMDREHLMEFLKLLQSEEKGTYNKAGACLFFHEHVVSLVKMPIGRGKVVYDLVDSMPSSNHGGRATRTRCRDLAALEILLRWYASRKFSESECTYIDRNDWDENMADFDPRVFQSFVWAE